MKNEVLVRIYTRPLFDLAAESKSLEAVGAEVKTLDELFRQVLLMGEYLDNPNLSRKTKLDTLKKAYDQPWSKYFANYLDLVLRKGRQEILPDVWQAFKQFWDEYNARLDVTVTSAVELSEAQKRALEKALAKRTGKTIVLKSRLEPTVLGGLRVQIGHQLVDATVAGKLAAMKEALLKS
jgi:F-type H+-transporting ATPase subunit delta